MKVHSITKALIIFLCFSFVFTAINLFSVPSVSADDIEYVYYTLNPVINLGAACTVRADASTFSAAYNLTVGEEFYDGCAGLRYAFSRCDVFRFVNWFNTQEYNDMNIVQAWILVTAYNPDECDYPTASYYITCNTLDLTPPLNYGNYKKDIVLVTNSFVADESQHQIEVDVDSLNFDGYSSFGVIHAADMIEYDPGWIEDTNAWCYISGFKLYLKVEVDGSGPESCDLNILNGATFVNGMTVQYGVEVPEKTWYQHPNNWFLWLRDADSEIIEINPGSYFIRVFPGYHAYNGLLGDGLIAASPGTWTAYLGFKTGVDQFTNVATDTFVYSDYTNEYSIGLFKSELIENEPIYCYVRCPSDTVFNLELYSMTDSSIVQTLDLTMTDEEYLLCTFNGESKGTYFIQLKESGSYMCNSTFFYIWADTDHSHFKITPVKIEYDIDDLIEFYTERTSGSHSYVIEFRYDMSGGGVAWTREISNGDKTKSSLRIPEGFLPGFYKVYVFQKGGDIFDENHEEMVITINDNTDPSNPNPENPDGGVSNALKPVVGIIISVVVGAGLLIVTGSGMAFFAGAVPMVFVLSQPSMGVMNLFTDPVMSSGLFVVLVFVAVIAWLLK